MVKTCLICGETFTTGNNKKTCGEKCSTALRKIRERERIGKRKKYFSTYYSKVLKGKRHITEEQKEKNRIRNRLNYHKKKQQIQSSV